MIEPGGKRRRISRESRLLLLTIVVCVVVLLLLARLRFPEAPIVETTAPPLERLAARASYDVLASDIERVESMISPNLVVLRTARRSESMPRRIRDVLVPSDVSSDVQHIPALRINPDTALAALDPDVRIDGIIGGGQVNGTAAVLATDPIRRLGRVRVPEAAARQLTPLALTALRTPVYVVAVEGTQAGVTLRPVFLGRGDRFGSARWTRPLLPLGGIAVAPGALLFSLSGEFVGCVVIENGAPAIAGASDVLATIEKLASAPLTVPASLGIAVQPLTPLLAAATGAGRGIVVAEVDPDGPASSVLRPADVITALGGEPLDSPDRLLLQIVSRPIGQSVTVTVIRNRESLTVTLPLAAAEGETARERRFVGFERTGNVGTRVIETGQGRGYPSAELRPGDIVVSAGELSDPTPVQVRRLLDTAPPDTLVIFTIRRTGEQLVVAVRVPASADAPRN